mgnify:CR=1 FL=1
MARSTYVYVTYIRTTPEKRWSALTDAAFMQQYWFGVRCESRWTAGSSGTMGAPDGTGTAAGGGLAATRSVTQGDVPARTGPGIR